MKSIYALGLFVLIQFASSVSFAEGKKATINSLKVQPGQKFYITGSGFFGEEAGWGAHAKFSANPDWYYSFDVEDDGQILESDSPTFTAPMEPGNYTIEMYQYVYDPDTQSYPEKFMARGRVMVQKPHKK